MSARLNRDVGGQGDRLQGNTSEPPLPTAEYTSLPAIGPVPQQLITYLEAVFPNRLPPEGTPESELWALWGQRRVVEHLKQKKEEQDNNVLQQTSSHA